MTTEERLERLERTNRRLTWGMGLTGLAALLVVAAGMARTETVPRKLKAHSFELVDDQGERRGAMFVTEHGSQLGLCDPKGNVRVSLDVGELGPLLNFSDAEQHSMISLHAGDAGSQLSVSDSRGKDRIYLGTGKKDEPNLILFDKAGKTRAVVRVANNVSMMGTADEDGKTLFDSRALKP
jgi:hypothetical protein